MCINNPHWQSSGIIIFLCKYYIVISDTLVGSFLNVLFLLLAVISELHEKPKGIKIELQKKVHRKICVRDITFLTARLPFYVIFCCFFCLLPPPSQVTYLLNGPIHNCNTFKSDTYIHVICVVLVSLLLTLNIFRTFF